MKVTTRPDVVRNLAICWLAIIVASAAVSGPRAAPASAQSSRTPATFAGDVAPILYSRCAGCHRPGGDAPFSLISFEEARARASQLAAVTQSRYMPPWKPEPGYGAFEGDRRLTDTEIRVFDRWIAGGLMEGDPSDLPPPPRWPDGWPLGDPDLVVTLPEHVLRADGPDVFRNFVVSVPGTGVRFVRGFQFRPGGRGLHHANIRVDPTPASRRLDAADPAPGYEGLILHSADYPQGHFLGWTPGQAPPLGSSDLAWRLEPGSDFVVQLHMQPTGKVERLQPAIGLYFSDQPPSRTPSIFRLGRQTIDIPPGVSDATSADAFVLPVDVEIHAVQPHAHYRARDVNAWATLPDGSRRWLIRIQNWDFNWQDQYRYKEPFWLPAGTRIETEYVFDNSDRNPRNPTRPPSRVSWGWRTSDEMGDVWIQAFTRSDADRARLAADSRRKMLTEDAAGCEVLIAREPAHTSLRNDAALIYMELGRPRDALRHFEAVSRLEPASASAKYNEGVALEASGRNPEATTRYEEAIGLEPNYSAAHNNLGNMLLAAGRAGDAIRHYRLAVDLAPANAEARNNLGGVLVAAVDSADAVAQLREALRLRPDFPDAHFNLGRAYTREGRPREAAAEYRAALALRPDWPPGLTNLAWLLATHPDPQFRDPEEALRAAERAVAATNRQDSAALDALGAAYAASGRFDAAIAAATEAATRASGTARRDEIASRIELYRQRKAFILPL